MAKNTTLTGCSDLRVREWRGKISTQGPGGDNHHDLRRVVGVGSGHAMAEGDAVALIYLAFAKRMEFQLHMLSGLAGAGVVWQK